MKKYDEFDKEETTSMEAQEVGDETAEKVNPKEKATALIERELAKKGVPHTENEVEDAIGALYAAYEADGAIPTREAFAEQCANVEVGETVVAMKRDPFIKGKLGKGGVAAICAGCVLAIALIGGGVWYATASQPQDARDTGSAVVSATEKKDAVGQDKADDAKTEKADEQESDAEDEAKDENSQTDGQATDTATQDDGGKGASGGNGSTASTGNNGGGGNTGSASKPNGGSTGGNGGGSSTQTQQPTHTHNWVPVTTTVHHDAQYKTVHHDAVTQERSICNSCGADITGNESAHMKEYALKGDMSHSYSIVPVTVQAAYDEQVLVSGAWDETVTTGYRCSTCGATK